MSSFYGNISENYLKSTLYKNYWKEIENQNNPLTIENIVNCNNIKLSK